MVEFEKEFCPICGSELVVVKPRAHLKQNLVAFAKRPDFCCFVGCVRVELHDKAVDGVNCRGMVIVKAVFHGNGVSHGR